MNGIVNRGDGYLEHLGQFLQCPAGDAFVGRLNLVVPLPDGHSGLTDVNFSIVHDEHCKTIFKQCQYRGLTLCENLIY